MVTHAAVPQGAVVTRALSRAVVLTALGLLALAGLSLLVRTQRLGVGFWIDEGLSVGIADRPLTDIPGVLRLDGSPPLYYMVLNLWLQVAGRTEEATHTLSLIFALATVPVAFALVRSLFGERAGWVAAVLAAFNPFLTAYAQETRMYAMVALLGTVTACAFAGAFAFRRGRAWIIAFAVSLAALMYTHNWALFFGLALGVAWLVLLATAPRDERRSLGRDGLIAFGGVALLYAPWVPSLLFQAAHTGAPWARAPKLSALAGAPTHLLGETGIFVIALGAGLGIAAALKTRRSAEARAVVALLAVGLGTIVIAWTSSQAEPAWATRYLAVALAPLFVALAVGLARAKGAGLVALGLVAAIWANDAGPKQKSNVREVAGWLAPTLRPGDLVISTQPEQAPVLAYYLDGEVEGLRWASITGPLTDLGVTDWRDGPERLGATSPERDLGPLADRVAPGQRIALVEPRIASVERWSAPWTRLVRLRSSAWRDRMQQDPRFRVVASRPAEDDEPGPNPVKATVFLRIPMR